MTVLCPQDTSTSRYTRRAYSGLSGRMFEPAMRLVELEGRSQVFGALGRMETVVRGLSRKVKM